MLARTYLYWAFTLYCCSWWQLVTGVSVTKRIAESTRDVLLFQAIGDSPEAEAAAILNVIQAAQQFMALDRTYWMSTLRRLYIPNRTCYGLSSQLKNSLRVSLGIMLHCLEGVKVLKDSRIGVRTAAVEHVSEILYALRHTLEIPSGQGTATATDLPGSEIANMKARVLYLAYSDTTGVFPTPAFMSRWQSSDFKDPTVHRRTSWSFESSRRLRKEESFDLLLLSKTKGFTSVSDWHDLQIMAFKMNRRSLSGLQRWLSVFHSTYMDYADRAAYNMLEPRPALVEATVQCKRTIRIRYWTKSMVVPVTALTPNKIATTNTAMLRLVCNTAAATGGGGSGGHLKRRFGNPDESYDADVCYAAHYETSLAYRKRINTQTPSVSGMLVEVKDNEFDSKLPWGMEFGSLRYRLGNAKTGQPQPYCFEHSENRNKTLSPERPPSAYIYDNFDKKRRYRLPTASAIASDKDITTSSTKGVDSRSDTPKETNLSSKGKILVMSGVLGSTIPQSLYIHLHKQYYARRHGYKFLLQLSDKFTQYFPKGLWRAYENVDASSTDQYSNSKSSNIVSSTKFINHRDDDYFEGVMSKVLMALDALCTYSDSGISDSADGDEDHSQGSGQDIAPAAEWIWFTDGDVHINAEWLHLPLETFLSDVPAEKVFVHGNYRSMMTGAFFIRNNEKGRKLVRDWLAIVMSGYVTCHAYDQSALQILMLLRQFPEQPYMVNLGNFSALHLSYSRYPVHSHDCGVNGRSVEYISETEQAEIRAARPYGCNPEGFDFSADYKFEKALMNMGFRGDFKGFWGDYYTSYSMGCANAFIRDFHVITETPNRPRLQCFHCSNTKELGTCVWDGHIGGGNERVRAGSINSWFTNHKAMFLFHEQYLDVDSCAELAEPYLDPCSTQYQSSSTRLQDPVAAAVSDTAGDYLSGTMQMESSSSSLQHASWSSSAVSVANYHMLFTHSAQASNSELYKHVVTAYRNKKHQAADTYTHSSSSSSGKSGAHPSTNVNSNSNSNSVDGTPPTLLSQHDGVALNLVTGQFCTVDGDARRVQAKITIMSEYAKIIGIARTSYSDASWEQLYKHNVSYGEVKASKCLEEEIAEGRCPDGIPTARKDSNWFLYPRDVCALRDTTRQDDATASGGWCIPSKDNVVFNSGDKSLGKLSVECLGRERDHLGFS